MPGNMFLKMGQHAVEKKYGGKSQQTEKPSKFRGKKVDSFHYWGARIEKRKEDGTTEEKIVLNEKKYGAHTKDTAYFELKGIPQHDAQILSLVMKQARWLDGGFTVPIVHTKFGVSALFGLVPIAGDAIDGILAMMLVTQASRVSGGLGGKIRSKMVANVILEIIIGLTPMLGDFADIFFRCNTKNAKMLEKLLEERAKHPGKAVRDAEKMGFAAANGHADVNERYHTQATAVRPPRTEDGHEGVRQRVPTTKSAPQPVKMTQAPGRDQNLFGKLKARAQDVGPMADVMPARRTNRPENGQPF